MYSDIRNNFVTYRKKKNDFSFFEMRGAKKCFRDACIQKISFDFCMESFQIIVCKHKHKLTGIMFYDDKCIKAVCPKRGKWYSAKVSNILKESYNRVHGNDLYYGVIVSREFKEP